MTEYHVTVLCNCGREHPSWEDWQKCPMALAPRPIEAWWRDPKISEPWVVMPQPLPEVSATAVFFLAAAAVILGVLAYALLTMG